MKTPIIIAGLVGLVLFSSKSSPKSKKITKSGIGPINASKVCTSNQYKNDKDQCIDFWIDGETDDIVLKEINIQLEKIKNHNFTSICEDKVIDELNGEYAPNDNFMKVVKDTIISLWPSVTNNQLPPKNGSPKWLKMIWMKTTDIYSSKICGTNMEN